jgi:hypothetical protein
LYQHLGLLVLERPFLHQSFFVTLLFFLVCLILHI